MFGPETTTLADDDLIAYTHQCMATPHPAGGFFTHMEIAVSWAYREGGFLMPVPGRDLSQDLDELCRRIWIMVNAGARGVLVFMAGDGRSLPKNPDGTYPYNDPVGDTYGWEWLMDNTERILRALIDAGLKPFTIPTPGYDACFYGWGDPPGEPDRQPERVQQWLELARRVWGQDGILAFEHSAGNFPTGEGTTNFDLGQPMHECDVLLHELGSSGVHNDMTWQIVARSAKPYNRPADQTPGDDPAPPLFMPEDSPRGKRRRCIYEYWTYGWGRDRVSKEQVDADRLYLLALGPGSVC